MSIRTTDDARELAGYRWGTRPCLAFCGSCDAPIPDGSRYRGYCSERCRVRAWRAAKKAEAGK